MRKHLIWLGNCMRQFKNTRMFYWLCRDHKENNIQHMSSFKVVHGKGEYDGSRACVERALARDKLKFKDSTKFRDAHAIVYWCNTKLSIGTLVRN